MDNEFWRRRWRDGAIGWHSEAVNPNLSEHVGRLAAPPGRILVPLCGKTTDLPWLAERGHAVVGIELSELGVDAFFDEAGLTDGLEVSTAGPFRRYRSGPIEILQGDFFELTREHLGAIDAVYDRAALIALPEPMRVDYAARIADVLPPGAPYLLVTLDAPERDTGPPFSVLEDDVRKLYSSTFAIEVLGRREIEEDDRFAGMHEGRYLLTRNPEI